MTECGKVNLEESAKVDLSEKALRKLTAGMISNIEAAPTLDEMVRDGKTAWGMPNQNMGLILQDQPDDSTPTPKPTEKPTPTPALPEEPTSTPGNATQTEALKKAAIETTQPTVSPMPVSTAIPQTSDPLPVNLLLLRTMLSLSCITALALIHRHK